MMTIADRAELIAGFLCSAVPDEDAPDITIVGDCISIDWGGNMFCFSRKKMKEDARDFISKTSEVNLGKIMKKAIREFFK